MAHNECMGCTKRHVGCHSTCSSYLEFKKYRENVLHEKYIENQARRDFDHRVQRKNVLSTHMR